MNARQELMPADHSQAVMAITPMGMIQMAVQQGADIDKLRQLLDLQERWEKTEARKAFVAALSAFKANPPLIYKNKQVSFSTQKGKTEYRHATLGEVSDAIGQSLAGHGLSHRWNVEQMTGGMIRVTCILMHQLGHSESVSLEAGRDESGSKNNIQAVGSTVTYLQRYTLLAATGCAVSDSDDDGRGSEEPTRHHQERHQADPAKTEPAKQEQAETNFYPADKFTENLPKWRAAIESGARTAQFVIDFAASKGTPLSSAQQSQLKGAASE
jgi:hypothetical protein